MFEDLKILISGDYNAFDDEFKGAGIYAVSGLSPTWVETPVYVGSSEKLEKRVQEGHIQSLEGNRHPNKPLQYYFNNHGKENLVYFLLEKVTDSNILFTTEQKYIDFYGILKDKKSFNIAAKAGSSKGLTKSKWTDERKLAHTLRVRGRKCSEKTIERLRKSHLGFIPSAEAREKISKANSGKIRSEKTKALMSKCKERPFSVLSLNSGFIHDFVNIEKFCRENKISSKNLHLTRNPKI